MVMFEVPAHTRFSVDPLASRETPISLLIYFLVERRDF